MQAVKFFREDDLFELWLDGQGYSVQTAAAMAILGASRWRAGETEGDLWLDIDLETLQGLHADANPDMHE